jgi:hypothetical protein
LGDDPAVVPFRKGVLAVEGSVERPVRRSRNFAPFVRQIRVGECYRGFNN